MLSTLSVRNFQSLHEVDLDLAPFTVIVGPSSSGKSALTRAIKTLAGNARGTAFIEHGQKSALIAAENEEHRISLKRTAGTTGNEYRVTPLEAREGASEARYTKLGGTTPPEVSEALRLAPEAVSWLAGQFDAPYLLKDSGGEVARTLGALTNVNVIFEASREANRQRQAAAGVLKTRQADLENVKNLLGNFDTLKARAEAVVEAEAHLERYLKAVRAAEELQENWEALSTAVSALKSARGRLQGSQEALERAKRALEKADALTEEWEALMGHVSALQVAKGKEQASGEALAREEKAYEQALHALGTCPTCGQAVA